MAQEDDDIKALVLSLDGSSDLDEDTKALVTSLKKDYGIEDKKQPKAITESLKEGFMGTPPAKDAPLGEKVANVAGDVGIPTLAAMPFAAMPPVSAAVYGGVRATQLAARQGINEVNKILNPGAKDLTKPIKTVQDRQRALVDVMGGSLGQFFNDAIAGPILAKGMSVAGEAVGEGVSKATGPIRRAVNPYIEKLLNQFPSSKYVLTESGRKASINRGIKEAADSMEWLNLQRAAINKKLGFRESFLGPKKVDYLSAFGRKAAQDVDTIGKAAKAPLVETLNEIKLRVSDIPATEEHGLAASAGELRNNLVGKINTTEDNAVLTLLNKYTGLPSKTQDTGILSTGKAFGKSVLNPKQAENKVSVTDMMEDFKRLGQEIQDGLNKGIYDTQQTYALRQFRDSLGNRIEQRIGESGQGVVAKAWKENRAGWSAWFDKFQSKTAYKIQTLDPDKVLDHVLSGEFPVEEAKAVLHPNTWQTIKQHKVSEILAELKNSGDSAKTLADKYSKGYLEKVFDPQEVSYIRDVAKLGDLGAETNAAIDNLMAGRMSAATAGKRASDVGEVQRRAEDVLLTKSRNINNYIGSTLLASVVVNEVADKAFGVKIPRVYLGVLAAAGVGPRLLANVYIKGGPAGSRAIAGVFKAMGKGSNVASSMAIKNLLKLNQELEQPKPQENNKPGLGKLSPFAGPKAPEAKPQNFPRLDTSRDGLENIINRADQEDPSKDIESLFPEE